MNYIKISSEILNQINSMNTVNGGVSMTSFTIDNAKDHVEIKISAPSVSGDAFNILLNNNNLIINTFLRENEDKNRLFPKHPAFSHVFDIPNFIDVEGIEALHENGVLKVLLPYRNGIGNNNSLRKINIKYN